MKNYLITGIAGFIGSNFWHLLIKRIRDIEQHPVRLIAVDALTYCGHFQTIAKSLEENSNWCEFHQLSICDFESLQSLFKKYTFHSIIHFAAETHVDNSISNPAIFTQTNVVGTQNLLQLSLAQWLEHKDPSFRYVQISTDEVYGHLTKNDPAFTESSSLMPNSPYSASKAGADLLVRSFYQTYGLPTIITRCSNNYGPYQYPEKLIPLMIHQAVQNKQLPVYGEGKNIRDWIHVEDHCQGIIAALRFGRPGKVYNFGAHNEWENLALVKKLLALLNKSEDLIRFVQDRPGHDFRYAIDCHKTQKDLNWIPQWSFSKGLEDTVQWYLENKSWIQSITRRKEELATLHNGCST